MENDTFYGDFMVKLVEDGLGFSWRKKWYNKIKIPDNLYINFTIKSP